jgi:hypothetical protein
MLYGSGTRGSTVDRWGFFLKSMASPSEEFVELPYQRINCDALDLFMVTDEGRSFLGSTAGLSH